MMKYTVIILIQVPERIIQFQEISYMSDAELHYWIKNVIWYPEEMTIMPADAILVNGTIETNCDVTKNPDNTHIQLEPLHDILAELIVEQEVPPWDLGVARTNIINETISIILKSRARPAQVTGNPIVGIYKHTNKS